MFLTIFVYLGKYANRWSLIAVNDLNITVFNDDALDECMKRFTSSSLVLYWTLKRFTNLFDSCDNGLINIFHNAKACRLDNLKRCSEIIIPIKNLSEQVFWNMYVIHFLFFDRKRYRNSRVFLIKQSERFINLNTYRGGMVVWEEWVKQRKRKNLGWS